MSLLTKRNRSTVVIAEDNDIWEPGIDFGCALGKRGLRVVRLLSDRSSAPAVARRRKLTDLLCDEAIAFAYPSVGVLSAAALAAVMDPSVVDVQCSEPVLAEIHRVTRGRLPSPVSQLPLAQAVDKVALQEFLAARGVPTPSVWRDADEIPSDALGPFMVKQRSGAGGEAAKRCADIAEVRVAVESEDCEMIIQPFLQGDVIDSAGVAHAGKVLQAVTYRNQVDPKRPFEGARGVVLEAIPDLLSLTHDVVREMGITGPFAIDAVRNAAGQAQIIDVNLRVFGCWAALQEAGIDVIGCYLFTLGLAGKPGDAQPKYGRRFELLRFDEPIGQFETSRRKWLTDRLVVVALRRPYLGAKWAAVTALRLTRHATSSPRAQ